MPQTVIPFGSPDAHRIQSVGLFAATLQRTTNLNRLTGTMPKQADAENRARLQTSTDYPIVRVMDLTKNAGDEVTFDLINHIGGKPIMGERMAEGRGVKMSFAQDRLRINQTRKPISAGGKMTQQRTPHELRPLARAEGQGYMDRLVDQLTIVHLAGARGQHTPEWVVPLENDPDFQEICVNPIKAPTANRHFIATSDGIERFNVNNGEVNLLTTETLSMDVLDAISTTMESMGYAPAPVKFDGDMMAADEPLRVLMVSPEQHMAFVKTGNFRLLQATAAARSTQAKNNPIFMGQAGIWAGVLMVKMPKPIRFYGGQPIRYCADQSSEVESVALVPDSFRAAGYAVDRAILLGSQALAQAFGKERGSGVPFFWSEKMLDHGDKLEVLIGMVAGMSKIRFAVDQDGLTVPTDNGVVVIDTAVKIATT
jgi:N4-gp56 family major capsid protein